jgi:hypothetical protein
MPLIRPGAEAFLMEFTDSGIVHCRNLRTDLEEECSVAVAQGYAFDVLVGDRHYHVAVELVDEEGGGRVLRHSPQ